MTHERETQNEQTERIPTAAQRAAWDRLFDILLRPIDDMAVGEQGRQSGGDEEVADSPNDAA